MPLQYALKDGTLGRFIGPVDWLGLSMLSLLCNLQATLFSSFAFSFFNLIQFLSSFHHLHVRCILPTGMHHFNTQFLLSHPSFICYLFGQMTPLEFIQIFDIPQITWKKTK